VLFLVKIFPVINLVPEFRQSPQGDNFSMVEFIAVISDTAPAGPGYKDFILVNQNASHRKLTGCQRLTGLLQRFSHEKFVIHQFIRPEK